MAVFVLSFFICRTGMIVNYKDPWQSKTEKAGILKKQSQVGQMNFNYAEGPDNGHPLMPLNVQHMDWYSYNRVLPKLSEKLHIFAVDYQGHGKTTYSVDYTMNTNQIDSDLGKFIVDIIKEPVFISENSSSGLIST